MEKICKNCKFFKKLNCLNEKLVDGTKNVSPQETSNMLIAMGSIRVNENFGCIHFEAKE